MTRDASGQAPLPRGRIDPDGSKSWWRRVMPIARAHSVLFGSAIVVSLLGLVLQVIIPALLNDAVNAVAEPATADSALASPAIWIVILAVAAFIAGLISRYLQLKAAYEFEYDLRNLTFEHLARMSSTFYDRMHSGDLISRANSDIRAVQTFLAMAPQVAVQLAMAVVAFGFMLAINPILAVVTMATMPLTFFIGMRMRRVMYPLAWMIQSRLSDISTIVEENVSGVTVVKSFAAERRQVARFEGAALRLEWAYRKEADLRARWMPLIQSMPTVGLFLVISVGGGLAMSGGISPGVILAFSAYLVMLQAPFMMLGQVIMLAQRASASAGRIFEVLDQAPEVVEAPDAVALPAGAVGVRFADVRFGYPAGGLVLDGLDLDIPAGQTLAIVGRTGSGKSSLGKLLLRFYDPVAGGVAIEGIDLREARLGALRSTVAVVAEESFLFSDTVAGNIAFCRPDATLEEVEAAARVADAHEFILQLEHGYDTVVGERGLSLSGGQRQRIALARAILLNPPVLVLDDATSAIDVGTEERIHRALADLMRDRTTVLVAHRPSTIALADRVVVLDGGRIAADGTHAELIAESALYRSIIAAGGEDTDRDRHADDLSAAQDAAAAALAAETVEQLAASLDPARSAEEVER